jgi:hypothetical protein
MKDFGERLKAIFRLASRDDPSRAQLKLLRFEGFRVVDLVDTEG